MLRAGQGQATHKNHVPSLQRVIKNNLEVKITLAKPI